MKLSELLKNGEIAAWNEVSDREITGVCSSSSHVRAGGLFVAITGLHSDGHRFIGDAVARGAVAVAVEKLALLDGRVGDLPREVAVVPVEDTRAALARLSAAFCGNPQNGLRLVGVTGTNGKTTCTRLIYEILCRAGISAGLIGTVGCIAPSGKMIFENSDPNANMTTPDPEQLYPMLARMREEGAEVVVMEVTSHALHFSKVEPLSFEIGVFTNLSEDHLDLHGTMEQYFAEKAKLFSRCERAVINGDDRYGRILASGCGHPLLCSAEGRDAVFCAEDVRELGTDGVEYKLTAPFMRLRISSPMPGRFNVMNTMQAAAVAHLLGVKATDIKDALAFTKGVTGRLERIKIPEKVDFSVYLDYAHTPDALEKLLRTARGFLRGEGRIVLLFGCGGDREREKRAQMGKVAVALADHVIITSDNSRSERATDIISDIRSGIGGDACATYTVIEDRRDAIEYAVRGARRGDVILLAGKGHEEYEVGKEGKKPFSERALVLEFIKKYYG